MSRRYDDGFSTLITLSLLPAVKLYEKDVTPPGVTAGGPIDTTTMRNTAWRTMSPRQLKTLSPISATVAFAFEAQGQILNIVGRNQLITVTFPDNATVTFYGWVEEFTPGAFTEGEQPTATLTIQPSNHNNAGVEVAPDYTGGSGSE